MPLLKTRRNICKRNATCSKGFLWCMIPLTGMPNGGRLPLDFFVIGESTPGSFGMGKWCWRLCCYLLLEKSRLQQDVFSGNWRTSQKLQCFFSVMKAERFVWAAIVQLFSFIGVDVIHHSGYICLFQVVKAAPFRKYSTDQFMVDLDGSFLMRTAGIAIK